MQASLPSFWMALEILFLSRNKSRNKTFPLRTTSVRIRGVPGILKLDDELHNAGVLSMEVGSCKLDHVWKTRTYRVPAPSRQGFRWKASALKRLHRFSNGASSPRPATIMVPALFNLMPAESLAMGWLNEIEALVAIRQRMVSAAKITGWDVFTFHTLHNLDHFFDTTINAVRDTWVKEGNLSPAAILETKRRFGKPYDYFQIPARLVENLVFQSSLMEWISRRSPDVPLRFQVVGTALLSGLVSSGSVQFGAAVKSALKFGSRWDATLNGTEESKPTDEKGWLRFERLKNLMEGRHVTSLAVPRMDMPEVYAPSKPFWYSPTMDEDPTLISTRQHAAMALETLNLSSWAHSAPPALGPDESVRGWLISPSHPNARLCRWSVSNYLLATPASVNLFLEHIAPLGRAPMHQLPEENLQNRFRLPRMKVTGP
jgi:hypothetical protein